MSDILTRLKLQAELGLLHVPMDHKTVSYAEAADEIGRLQSENARLTSSRDGYAKGRDEIQRIFNIERTRAEAAEAEVKRLREAVEPAYMGLCVLKTMCRKAKLAGGVEATESAMRGLVEAVPELPALSALREYRAALNNTGDDNGK